MALLIVAALIHQDERILLVEQQGPEDHASSWALPGGVAQAGELLHEALRREVAEETGLMLNTIDRLAYVTQFDDPQAGVQSIAFVFEAIRWTGELRLTDPDRLIIQARWLPLTEALERLEALPWRRMREPLVSYLRGESAAGSVWIYRRRAGGSEELSLCCCGES